MQPTRLLPPWDSPGKSIGVGCHFLLQGIFLIQGLNSGLLHCRQILHYLSYLELKVRKDGRALGIPGGISGKRTCLPMPEMQGMRVQFLAPEDPLEKEMATHSSILARKIPQTAEPGRQQFTGSQRVGHD